MLYYANIIYKISKRIPNFIFFHKNKNTVYLFQYILYNKSIPTDLSYQ